MESVESQKQASPSFHEPLGNLAKAARFPHSRGSDRCFPHKAKKPPGGLSPPARAALRAASLVPFSAAQVVNFYSALDTCIDFMRSAAEAPSTDSP